MATFPVHVFKRIFIKISCIMGSNKYHDIYSLRDDTY
jgi:hypothetical protein